MRAVVLISCLVVASCTGELRSYGGGEVVLFDDAGSADTSGSDAREPDAALSEQDGGQITDASPRDIMQREARIVPPAPQDDPAVVNLLNALAPGESMRLPQVVVQGPTSTWYTNGPNQRNFCNRMAYAPDRQTALYAGGNHGSPHVINDVWEYALGSNTWQNLYEPVGGNHARWLDERALILSNFDGAGEPAPEDEASIESFKMWWKDNVTLSNGHLHDSVGNGPIYPRHTWDTLVYDPVQKKMLWPLQASGWMFSATVHKYVHGLADTPVVDSTGISRMWSFDPQGGTWEPYAFPAGQDTPTFKAVAASMVHLGDSRFVYFTSSQAGRGEIPGMWKWNTVTDTWTPMAPNGGRDFRQIALDGAAPRTDAVAAYSPKHDVILSVGQGAYVGPEKVAQLYRFDTNTWSATTAPPFRADDSRSVLVYAPVIERFVLVHPFGDFNTTVHLYDPVSESWEQRTLVGSALTADKAPMGYYDPRFDVVVVQQNGSGKVWIYRP